jgi:hypothetical protein
LTERLVSALAILAMLAVACTRASSGSISAQPPDLYAALPSLSDVRTMLGDDAWWPGPPSFAVRPLGSASMASNEKFGVTQTYVHIGSAETFGIDYTLWNATTASKTYMSNVQTALGTSATGPTVGDQSLYYGSQGSGGAPYSTVTFVRIGQIITTISWSFKDAFPKTSLLGKIAAKVVSRIKDVVAGKLHGTPPPASDTAVLPPANLDITQVGQTRISVEASMVMISAAAPDKIAQTLRGLGVNDVVFGDYALNSDTRMEVRATVFAFSAAKSATDWLSLLRGTYPLDQNGVASFYDDSRGIYMFLFAEGTRGALLICQSTASSEAASRACEAPLSRVIATWKIALGS